jgi:hypothetical protein
MNCPYCKGEQGCHMHTVGLTVFGKKVKLPLAAYVRMSGHPVKAKATISAAATRYFFMGSPWGVIAGKRGSRSQLTPLPARRSTPNPQSPEAITFIGPIVDAALTAKRTAGHQSRCLSVPKWRGESLRVYKTHSRARPRHCDDNVVVVYHLNTCLSRLLRWLLLRSPRGC